jgi:deoxyuridine 5'-triphosphate nucleotidohydrolase
MPALECLVSAVSLYALSKPINFKAYILEGVHVIPTLAFLDSRSMGNFINEQLVTKNALHCTPCPTALQLHSVTDNKFHQVTKQTKIMLHVDPDHQEEITLNVAPISHNQIILGLPWMALHQPQVNWATGKITGFSEYCHKNCLPIPSEEEELHPPMDASILGGDTCNISKLQVKWSHPDAMLPTQGTPGSAGWDLYSIESATLAPGQRQLVDTGISIKIPEGMYAQITPRSGLAWKHGIHITTRVINTDYQGYLKVLMVNQGTQSLSCNHKITLLR